LFDYPTPLIFETRAAEFQARAAADRSMDRYRGPQVSRSCVRKGYVLTPNYTSAAAFDRTAGRFRVGGNELAARPLLACVASRDAAKLNQPIESGHVSSALCHLGGISHQLGKVATAAAIADQIKANDEFSASFDRMAAHLRANDVDIDSGNGTLTLGAMLEIDPKTEMFVKNDEANTRAGG
jgi:hypothetical protein